MGGGYFPNSGQHNPGQQYPGQQYPGQHYPAQQPTPFHEYSFASLVPVRHWVRDPALRSWPVLLLVVLVCVPPIALVLLNNATESTIQTIAWIFAAYFAAAWLLLLGVIVRPQHVTRAMLATVAVIGIVTQAPIAIFLETRLHAGTGSLLDIFTIGLPEELAKAVPIVAVALIWRAKWQEQAPRDYLFLGAVSGLVFGAAEAVHYFIDVLGSLSGNANGILLQGLTIQYIWRFLTDPIDHATWAGITGYFIGLAVTGHTRKYGIGLIGIGIAAVLHGLNDWNPINSHPAWVVITLISVLLFLGYARAGALLPPAFAAAAASTAGVPVSAHPAHSGPVGPAAAAHPQSHPQSHPQTHPQAQPTPPAQPRPPGAPVPQEAWWQAPPQGPRPVPAAAASHPGAASPPHASPHASPPTGATQVTVSQKIPPRPWWEQ
jgi:RsiW-degrading membrane proteinase PrsW (M82 family)